MKFFASCAKGLEYLLADELLALGAAKATAAVAGVNVEGEPADALRAVLWSRLASRILWPLAEFDCPDEHALYAGAAAIDWTQHLTPDMTLAVDAHVSGTAVTHARYAAQRTKDAVVDVLRTASGARPSVDVESPDLRLSLVLRKGKAILSVDLGGGPLHRRGWRQSQGDAPLKETLAAAVLMRGGWAKIHGEGGALLDPMCGSGTLLIEGALMAADVAPGLLRHGDVAPSRWLGFDKAAWQTLVGEAKQREANGRAALRPVFFGSDSDAKSIRSAEQNAWMAGVSEAIRWQVLPIDKLAAPAVVLGRHSREGGDPATLLSPENTSTVEKAKSLDSRLRGNDGLKAEAKAETSLGLAVCNPPYDARLAADAALYRQLGDALKHAVPQWRASLLCGDAELAHATGLRAQKKYQVFNGALECALIVCDPIATPVRADAAPRELSEGAQMVANRLRKNIRNTKSWRERDGVACYRIYDADLPEYAAAIDVYTEADDPDRRWLHVQEYAAPAEIPEADARRRFRDLLAAAQDALALPRERIATKTRERGKGGSKYGRFDRREEWIVVREGGVRLRVNLFDYLDTGLFLDHRPLRLRIAEEAEDARFLNLFGYTGAASVHAAAGRARQTTTVDLSATYLQWCADNLQENGFGGARHSLVQADALAWLEADRGRYDLIFCDPPTFSNSARADDFDVQREHVRLLRAAVARLAPGGVLYFSNNFRRFRLDAQAVSDFADCTDITAQTVPPDFARNPRIHQAWRLTAL